MMAAITTSEQSRAGVLMAPDSTADFVAVDDCGMFSYHPSGDAVVGAFEYAGEETCILDRKGNYFRLALDPDRRLYIRPSFGTVEFHWLRQAWSNIQRLKLENYRLRRFQAPGRAGLLAGLFETLQLEAGTGPNPVAWTLSLDSGESHPASLRDIDRCLASRRELDHVLIQDPFGHLYRPVRHGAHRFLSSAAGFICYIEVPRLGGQPGGESGGQPAGGRTPSSFHAAVQVPVTEHP